MLKLFQVTCWHDGSMRNDTFENFVIAKDKKEAKKLVEEGIWSLGGMKIKSVKEVTMSNPQILVSINTEDLE